MKYILAIGLLALAACQSTPQAPQTPVANVSVPAGSMLSLLNSQRAAQGRRPITEDANLSRAARDHAQDMVTNNYFSHTGRDGSSFAARARAAARPSPGRCAPL